MHTLNRSARMILDHPLIFHVKATDEAGKIIQANVKISNRIVMPNF